MFGKYPSLANSFMYACLGGKLLIGSNNGNGKWALLAAKIFILVAIMGELSWLNFCGKLWK